MMTMREYLETWDRNAPASFLTVGDVLAIYEKYDENPAVTAYRMEQEQEETPPADTEWLGDPRTPEQIDLDEWQAEASDVGFGKNGRPQ